MNDELLQEQVEYYRARANEYDDFWLGRGQHQRPPELEAQWSADTAEAELAVHDFAPVGSVLELACGTGVWTPLLAAHADDVTAVDSSPEVIEVNRAKQRCRNVDYLVADLFDWRPPSTYDVVFFGYWHSHVPDERLDDFWALVESALAPGGRVFLVDSAPRPAGDPVRTDRRQRRRLDDGRTFSIVKRYWETDELSAYLDTRGWDATTRTTGNGMILLAAATRAVSGTPTPPSTPDR